MRKTRLLLLSAAFIIFSFGSVSAQTTEINYQGSLIDGANPANGNYDFEFALFNAASGGAQQGSTLARNSVAVANGIFSVSLDFGSQFPGANRFLEIRVRQTGGGAFTVLLPRQPLTSAPYAIKSLTADNATSAANATTAVNFSGALAGDVTGTQSTTIIGTNAVTTAKLADGSVTDPKMTAVAGSKVTGSITTATIPGSNVTGAVASATTATNATNATTATTATNALSLGGVPAGQYVLTGDVRLSDARIPLPNSSNYIQNQNAGTQASSNFKISGNGTAGGTISGNIVDATTQFNISGQRVLSNAGTQNVFAGVQAGQGNTDGDDNSFFGWGAGLSNQDGYWNSFFGSEAGRSNVSGVLNTFFGKDAGYSTTSSFNAFFGYGAGSTNTAGGGNTYLGFNAKGTAAINNATAVGWRATVESSNSLVLGSIKNKNGAGFNAKVGIGIPNPVTSLHIATETPKATATTTRAFSISTSDTYTTPGNAATPFTLDIRLTGGATLADRAAYIQTTELDNADGGNILLQPTAGKVGIGTTSPTDALSVNGVASKNTGSTWAVFSDERLKNIDGRFTPGLKALMQLQPIRYQYKPGNALDLKTGQEYVGFSAQAVEKVIPEAVTKTDTGYRMVNSDPILWTMLNAIKEQEAEIERQQAEIDALKALVCKPNRKAAVCKVK